MHKPEECSLNQELICLFVKFGNFTKYRDILRPYEIGAYSKVNIKYINPLTYDSITKIALF